MADNHQWQVELPDTDKQKIKKRRLHGSCDTCRKRKIKCDSATMPGNFCTNCQITDIQCTHDLPRHPKKKEQIVCIAKLKERIETLERCFKFLHPDKDIDHIIAIVNRQCRNVPVSPTPPLTAAEAGSSTSITAAEYPVHSPSPKSLPKASPESAQEETTDDEDVLNDALEEHLGQLSLNDNKFHGPASEFMFVKSTLLPRQESTSVRQAEKLPAKPLNVFPMRPWELEFISTPNPVYTFPEFNLLQSLVSLYFERPNVFLPVIHKPTFLKSLSAGQHFWDSSFGMTVLMVCALGARYSNDPRVLQDGDDTWSTPGWKWFSQIQVHRKSLLLRTSVYDLQYYALAATFLTGTSLYTASWGFIGLGIRLAMENGIHRRRGTDDRSSVEYAHLQRAFWCLVCLDRTLSSSLGRPSSITDEDFDVDYPAECDDEYWETEDSEQAFKQPPGKPCQISAFISYIKLCEILAFTLRTLYSTKKSKILTGIKGVEWEQRLVAELDSLMNQWKNSLPGFLQWKAEMPDDTFFHQSSFLHATYCYIRIQIHRPFLTKRCPLTDTSLTVCLDAAHACCHVLEISSSRGIRPFPNYFITTFSSAIVLLLHMRNAHRTGNHVDETKEMKDFQRCLRVLKECGQRWYSADILYEKLKLLIPLQQDRSSTTAPKPRDAVPATAASAMSWNVSQLAEEAAAPLTTMAEPEFPYSSSASAGTDALASSSGLSSTPSAKLPSQHPATANPGHFPELDMYSPMSTMPANEWDFIGNVLNMHAQHQQARQDFGLDRPPALWEPADPTTHAAPHSGASFSSSDTASTSGWLVDDILSVWSQGPVNFGAEEWDMRLGSIFDCPPNQL